MSRIIYTKYSNERASRFALRTDIMEENGRRTVRKTPSYSQGQSHVENIEHWYQELTKIYWQTGLSMNRSHMKDGDLWLEYLEGETLEEYLDNCLANGGATQVVDYLFEYLQQVKEGFALEQFTVTEEFQKVFGEDIVLPQELLSGSIVNIDMVLNNVILNQGKTLIDYEWTFDFPIPYHFVVYRILHYYLYGSTTRGELLELNLMEKAGLTPEEIDVYEKMEDHFQRVYVVSEEGGKYHVPLRSLYEEITPGEIDLTAIRYGDSRKNDNHLVQVYQAATLDFTEEHSQRKACYKEGIFLDSFAMEPESSYVRLDPASTYCIVRKLQMHWGEEVLNYKTNGILMKDGSIFFPVDDPQIIVEKPKDTKESFRTYFEIQYLNEEETLRLTHEQWGNIKKQSMELESQLRQREAVIHQMENTKIWKAYRKIKRQ